jgi:hypothetical protein
MKQHASLTAIVLVAGILFASLWFIRKQQPHTIPASPPSSAPGVPTTASGTGAPTQSAPTPGAAAAAVKTQPAVAPETRVEKVVPEQPVASTASVRIPVAKVLAKVNGTPITLKDLVAGVGADASVEQILSPAMYQALLERAIERELTFSAARAKGIELTEEQVRQREQVRQSLLARHAAPHESVVQLNVTGTLEDRIEFELRDVTSQLLLNSLLAKAGIHPGEVTEDQVQEYYQGHLDQYGALPGAGPERSTGWQRIDYEIRQKLAPAVQAEYAVAVRKYLEQLKAEASISLVAAAN